MKYTRVYDSHYEKMLLGYSCEKCFIWKETHMTGLCSVVCDGYAVETQQWGGKKLFVADTLREAKAFAESLKRYMFLCYDFHTGEQDCVFYGVGQTEKEALENADIPGNYELVEAFNLDEE